MNGGAVLGGTTDDCICAIKNNNLINNRFQVNMTYYLHMDVRVLDCL